MQKSNVLFAGCAALLNLLDALKKTTEQFFQLRTGSHIGGAVMACGCQGVSEQRDALAAHGFRIGLHRHVIPQHQC